jgi:hypothetical protein
LKLRKWKKSEELARTKQQARKPWLENQNLADDHFERDVGDEDVGILVGMDQMFNINMFNESAITSPCGPRASNSKLGKVIGASSQKKSTKQSQSIVSKLLINSNYYLPQITSKTSNFSSIIQSNK